MTKWACAAVAEMRAAALSPPPPLPSFSGLTRESSKHDGGCIAPTTLQTSRGWILGTSPRMTVGVSMMGRAPYRPTMPTRSLRDHPPRDGEGEAA